MAVTVSTLGDSHAAGHVAMVAMVGPVSTIALGYLFLDEPVSAWQVSGTVLVLAGVWVLSRKRAETGAA